MKTDNKNDSKKTLSRRKRYLVFPEGSSLQLVYCLTIPSVGMGQIFTLGATAALAWELPHDPMAPFRKPAEVLHRIDKDGDHSSGGWSIKKEKPTSLITPSFNNGYSTLNSLFKQTIYNTINKGYSQKQSYNTIENSKKQSYKTANRTKPRLDHPDEDIYDKTASSSKNCLGIPLDLKLETAIIGLFIKGNYPMPQNASVYESGSVIYERRKRSLSRWDIYKMLSQEAELRGHNGKSCVLKAICEAADTPVDQEYGLFEELFHSTFTWHFYGETFAGNME
ncbi:unnamed protein product [Brassicogethes aeneus]|uniref:Uncharacterized protein n=1 Tax=Brassicogethes aeneus TaxID=1431903 RepID=A0A9P0B332_BRAAE|nr:unnamed protein product [Brassicogethes aeneus]